MGLGAVFRQVENHQAMQAGVSIEEHINQVNTIVMDLLKGRVGIVTGAGTSHGIGRSAVLAVSVSLSTQSRTLHRLTCARVLDGTSWCTVYIRL